ncbi:MAG: transcription termination factor NusA [Bacillota bacterium]
MDKNEFMEALELVVKEKGLDKEIIFEAIEASLLSACKEYFGKNQNVKVIVDRETGNVACYSQQTVVEEVEDPQNEITVEEAKEINPSYEIGDVVDTEATPKDFGRISAQKAKQVVVQKFKEAEREILYNEYITKEREVVTALVQRRDRRNVILQMGKADAVLTPNEQIPTERYTFMERMKVYVVKVENLPKGPQILVSRTHPELVKRLFEQEVPEVFDGTVEIKSIAREAGNRTKIAVYSKNPDVDPLGACVGQNGYRVNVVVGELGGEKIDVIEWNEDPKVFIAAALSPSKVVTVVLNEEDQSAKIVVPDHQLSLAIGKEGQNARLSAKLTGWRIDIKSETQARETNFLEETPSTKTVAGEDDGEEDINIEETHVDSAEFDVEQDDFDVIDAEDTNETDEESES